MGIYPSCIIFFASSSMFTASLPMEKTKLNIVGGDDAPENSYSYTVSIQDENEHICGGGIIDDWFILTAAHCVIDDDGLFNQNSLLAVIGAVDLENIPQSAIFITIQKIYVPTKFLPQRQRYDPKYRTKGDIAVLKLKKSIELAAHQYLTKLEFSVSSFFDLPGREAVMTGYGYNEVTVKKDAKTGRLFQKGEFFGRMRYALARINPKFICESVLAREIHSSNICARLVQRNKNEPEGVCVGDSGGPLVRNGNVVMGILSTSPITCNETVGMGVYTRITSYKTFIKDAMEEKSSPFMRVAIWYDFTDDCNKLKPHLVEQKSESDSSEGIIL